MYRLDYAGTLMSVGCRKDYTTSFLAHHVISFRSYYYVPMLALHYANKKSCVQGYFLCTKVIVFFLCKDSGVVLLEQ